LIDFLKRSSLDVKSITFDNGSEFADHWRLKEELGIDTYFCDPGAPWQKGSIENLNGMLRRFFPFKVSAEEITNEQVVVVNAKINNMPREILSYKTPNEVLNELRRNEKESKSMVKAAWPVAEVICFTQKESRVAFDY
jgi:IS30 family transposase